MTSRSPIIPMLYFFPFPFLIGLALLTLVLFRLWRQKCSVSYLIAAFLFGMYLILLVDAVLFYISPIEIGSGHILTVQNFRHILSRVNLVPFDFGDPPNAHYLLDHIFYNILLTTPFGFGLNFFTHLRPRKVLWIAAAAGLATELSQFLVSLFIVGGPYRSVDINDSLLNMAGVWLGYGLFRLLVRIFPAGRHRPESG